MKLMVLDGNSLVNRAFFGIKLLTTKDGRYTNAIYGFQNILLNLLAAHKPDAVAIAWDERAPTFRHNAYDGYKATRHGMPEELAQQMPVLKELLTDLGFVQVSKAGWEADDILGTLAAACEAAGGTTLLATGDRDSLQLVDDATTVLLATNKETIPMDPAAIREKYGIEPPQLIDVKSLMGDASDNIPGVPGIGPKKASALIAQYGSLDEVIAHADEVKGKMGENLRAHIDDALLSRKVATIRTDAPVELDFEATSFPAFSADEVSAALGTLGITAMQNRFLALIGGEGAAAASSVFEIPAMVRAAAGDADALGSVAAEVSRAIDAGEWVAAVVDDDKEEGALFGLTRTLWLATSKGLFALEEADGGTPAAVDGFNFVHGVIAGVLARLFMEGRVASPDMKALLHELSPIDSSEPELMDPQSADSTRIFDTVVAAYLLDSDRSEFDEAYLADTYLQMSLPAARGAEGAGENAPAPAARTAALTLALVAPLRDRMARENAANVFDGIEMPLVPVLAKMERAGMLVDPDRLRNLSEGLATQITEVERSIRDLAGDETFNIGSPMQLSHVLFDVMGLPTKGLKKTKRGYYSTNAKVLSDLARDHEIVRLILDWREKSKIKSTYLDTLGPLRRGDGRVHTTYNQTITATGRLSSSDPNLQNMPTRSGLGRTVKTAFSAGEGSVFLAVDYSQIELRLLAHLSGDEHLVRAFNEGEDFHAETAARVFGVPVSEVTPDLRSRAKAVNFGIVYGQQAYGLSQSLHISMAEARDMIDRYYEAYPGVRTFLDNVVARAKQTGYAETMYGRRRHIPELKAKNPQLRGFGERTAMNHPMQGTAADIIKIAMARVSRRLEEEGFAAHMILQVHDELDFECPANEVERLTAMVQDVMEHVVDLRVPLIAEASTGITWADAK